MSDHEYDLLQAELKLTDKLYNALREVIKAIPECPEHGECIPHALEWIEKAKIAMLEQEGK